MSGPAIVPVTTVGFVTPLIVISPSTVTRWVLGPPSPTPGPVAQAGTVARG